MPKKDQDEKGEVRSLVIDVFMPNDKDHKLKNALREDMKHYRNVTRMAACTLFAAEVATAKENKEKGALTPDDAGALGLLSALSGKQGKAFAYGLYDWIGEVLGEWRAEYKTKAIDEIKTWWFAEAPRGPEHEGVKKMPSKGYMALNTARRLPRFQNLALPLKLGRMLKIDGHTLTVETRRKEPYRFRVCELDSSRWWTFKAAAQGLHGLSLCDGHKLIEGKHGFRLVLAYRIEAKPSKKSKAGRVMEVGFSTAAEDLIQCRLREGHKSTTDEKRNRKVSVLAALDILDRLRTQQDKIDLLRRACGNRTDARNRTGSRKAFKHMAQRGERLTLQRTEVVKHWNHVWSKHIVTEAVGMRASKITLISVPEDLLARPWQWHQFKMFVQYKAKTVGIEVEVA